MIEQRQVLSMLQDAMYQNSLKKSDRVNSMLDVEPEKTKTLNDIIKQNSKIKYKIKYSFTFLSIVS